MNLHKQPNCHIQTVHRAQLLTLCSFYCIDRENTNLSGRTRKDSQKACLDVSMMLLRSEFTALALLSLLTLSFYSTSIQRTSSTFPNNYLMLVSSILFCLRPVPVLCLAEQWSILPFWHPHEQYHCAQELHTPTLVAAKLSVARTLTWLHQVSWLPPQARMTPKYWNRAAQYWCLIFFYTNV